MVQYSPMQTFPTSASCFYLYFQLSPLISPDLFIVHLFPSSLILKCLLYPDTPPLLASPAFPTWS